MKICILISGKAGTGKSTVAKIINATLLEKDIVGTVVPFAEGIKKCAKEYIGWDGVKDEKGRKLLQTLGTEVGRAYDENVWAKYLFNTYSNRKILIVDDWRFRSELEYAKTTPYTIYTIRIEAIGREILSGTPYYNHPSEIDLPSAPDERYNYVIDNSGSKAELVNSVEKILQDILDKEKNK
jgi:dephospho-CoA kinase